MSDPFFFAIVLLAPLLGFCFNGLRFRSKQYVLAGSVATLASFAAFIASVVLVLKLASSGETVGKPGALSFEFFNWFDVGSLHLKASFVIDRISALMILVVTGVGTLIHLFSVGYMSHDERPSKYFAYLNLFLFNMLLLVTGDNLLVMFTGWEGVGLCSYLLIGFWFSDEKKAAAGMKAFITNRIGDAGFLLGIFLIFQNFGTLHFAEILARLPENYSMSWTNPINLACLCLFIGACGKSAQIPLYVWLPDAMAGPTPVSALIHAATMVTAGVYMIVRLHPMFLLAPNVLHVIAIVGAVTAVFAASIGLAQTDIKKVLAYSTVSQLGYMFLACGVGAFQIAMFHLMTHAFFKALMFLGSGSVIHAMHEEQDIMKMGGLKKYLPVTHFTFVLGWLAIIGMPPFAGFFSKDEILWRSLSSSLGHPLLYAAGLIGAVLTAFYMTRLMCLCFWGKSRFGHDVHPHESPPSMLLPLIVLGILSTVGGWVGIPEVLTFPDLLEKWFEGVIEQAPTHHSLAHLEIPLMFVSVFVAAASAYFAYYLYIQNQKALTKWRSRFSRISLVLENKYYVDELYQKYILNPLVQMAKGAWASVDVGFIDNLTYKLSESVEDIGSMVRYLQNGNMQQYALYICLGAAVFFFYLLGIR